MLPLGEPEQQARLFAELRRTVRKAVKLPGTAEILVDLVKTGLEKLEKLLEELKEYCKTPEAEKELGAELAKRLGRDFERAVRHLRELMETAEKLREVRKEIYKGVAKKFRKLYVVKI